MAESGIRGGICHTIYRYAEANNKYMKNYNKDIPSSYLMYLDGNNLYGWEMCKKLPVSNFIWSDDLSRYTEDFIKNYDENSDYGSILEVDIEYPKTLWGLHKDLPFLVERRKLGNVEKLVTNIEDKENYVIHISALKQALNHGLILKKVHRVTEFKQEACLKPYIDMNTKLRTEAKNDFEKDFLKLINNSVFEKTMENVRNHRDIKLVTTDERRNKLVSEPNYHITKHFSENLLAIEMKKTKIIMNKPIYLDQAILDISKTLMFEFWFDYIKPKYNEKAKLCYMDTDSFIIHIKTEDFYKDIAKNVNKWFDKSNYDKNNNRLLPIGINKKIFGMFKDELGGKIMKKVCAPRAKTYTYLLDDDTEKKKDKGTKKCVAKRRLRSDDYYVSVFENKTIIRSQQRFRRDHHTVNKEEVNKAAITSNDNKRLKTFNKVTTYPCGTNAFKVCVREILWLVLSLLKK